jgi:hypothetical protein
MTVFGVGAIINLMTNNTCYVVWLTLLSFLDCISWVVGILMNDEMEGNDLAYSKFSN